MASLNKIVVTHGFGRNAIWIGRSGKPYDVRSENFDRFTLGDGDLFMIAKGSNVLWVGSSDDLVTDPMSRSRFRLALDCADRVFRILGISNGGERYATIWDLEGAEPMRDAQAA